MGEWVKISCQARQVPVMLGAWLANVWPVASCEGKEGGDGREVQQGCWDPSLMSLVGLGSYYSMSKKHCNQGIN